jgi:hypothetical protein
MMNRHSGEVIRYARRLPRQAQPGGLEQRALNLNRHPGESRDPAQKKQPPSSDVICMFGLGPGLRRGDDVVLISRTLL